VIGHALLPSVTTQLACSSVFQSRACGHCLPDES